MIRMTDHLTDNTTITAPRVRATTRQIHGSGGVGYFTLKWIVLDFSDDNSS